ncbi:hypothetical protein RCO48_26835 [Peribacillus frigoritolerans]|nr:hypothetical protein [Peribacillus frigoritolerans]
MGSIASQCMNEGIQEISVTYAGESLDFDTAILTKKSNLRLFKIKS